MAVPLIIMILRFLFYAFLIYILVKLVFNFIIPVYKTTKKIKRGFAEMKEKMSSHSSDSQSQNSFQQKEQSSNAAKEDYIDFEEVRD